MCLEMISITRAHTFTHTHSLHQSPQHTHSISHTHTHIHTHSHAVHQSLYHTCCLTHTHTHTVTQHCRIVFEQITSSPTSNMSVSTIGQPKLQKGRGTSAAVSNKAKCLLVPTGKSSTSELV